MAGAEGPLLNECRRRYRPPREPGFSFAWIELTTMRADGTDFPSSYCGGDPEADEGSEMAACAHGASAGARPAPVQLADETGERTPGCRPGT
jgi:hypothetical protein